MGSTPERPPRVLLVEDNYDNRTIYRDIFQHGWFDVVEAANGREGIERAREARPAVILMDLSMPVMDGWEAVEPKRVLEVVRRRVAAAGDGPIEARPVEVARGESREPRP